MPLLFCLSKQSLPKGFIPTHLQKVEGEAALWDYKRRIKWDVRFRQNPTSNQVNLSTGWKKFREDNNLNIGDVCVFKRMNNSAEVSYRVKIFRATKASSPHHVEGN